MSNANAAISLERAWQSFRDGSVPQEDREGHEVISAPGAEPMGVANRGFGGSRLRVQFATVEAAASLKLVPGLAWVEQDGRRTPISLLESPSPVSEVPLRQPTRTEMGCLQLDPSREDGLSPFQFRRVVAFINERISRTVTLSDLAREAGLSVAYFSQRFKSSTGTSPHQYLLRLRICKAKKLLEESESSVIDIAAVCGFQTQQHFARIFRRLTMSTPTEYRRQSQRSALLSTYGNLPYADDISIRRMPSLSAEPLDG